MNMHTLTIYDPIGKANRQVEITIRRNGLKWDFQARFAGETTVLASATNLQAAREDEVLARALQMTRDARTA